MSDIHDPRRPISVVDCPHCFRRHAVDMACDWHGEAVHLRLVMRACVDEIQGGDDMGALRMLEVALRGGGRPE